MGRWNNRLRPFLGKLYDRRSHRPYPHAAYAAMAVRLDKQVGDIRAEKGVRLNVSHVAGE
jgi:hypothetical protein